MVCDQTSDPHQIWGEVHVDGGGFQRCQGSYHPAAVERCLYRMLVAECLQTGRGSCHHDEPWYKAVNRNFVIVFTIFYGGTFSKMFKDILFLVESAKNFHTSQCSDGVGCCVLCSFYVRKSSQHRQSSCSVHCTAALPVLAGLADIERTRHTAANTIWALCLV